MDKQIGYRWLVRFVWSVITGQASWIIHDGGIATWVAGTAALLRRGGLGDASGGHRSPIRRPYPLRSPTCRVKAVQARDGTRAAQ